MGKLKQSRWLVAALALAAILSLPVAAESGGPEGSGLAAGAAPEVDGCQAAPQAEIGAGAAGSVPALGLPPAEPSTAPPGSCPRPTCDATVHCLWMSCPAGQGPVCNGGLGAGCEGTCGCR